MKRVKTIRANDGCGHSINVKPTCQWCGATEDCDCDTEVELEKARRAHQEAEAPRSAFRSDLEVCAACGFPLIFHGSECEK